jgi:lactoylglutathione lyase
MLKFGYTILYVKDVKATLAFYEKAFGLKTKFVIADNSYGELDTPGSVTLAFASIPQANSNLKDGFIESDPTKKPQAMEIGFVTNDVKAAYDQAVKAGAVSESEPAWKPHGQTVAYVRDLNGFLVEICTPVN